MKRVYIYIALLFLPLFSKGQIITTVAGGTAGHGGNWGIGGLATNAQLNICGGVAVDRAGNVYITDGSLWVYKVDVTTGIIHTVAGTGTSGYNGDNIQATAAELTGPGQVVTDVTGNFYVVDGIGYRIRKVDIATGVITTIAGNGTYGYSGDHIPATAANFDFNCLTIDDFGNLILPTNNYRIQKIDPTGILTTIAGTGIAGESGDGGPATAARLTDNSYGISTDKFGNIYFADSNRSVRKINVSTGIISRVAGTGDFIGYPYSGDNGPATNAHLTPRSIAIDDTGNLYIADDPNSRIEKVDTFGIIHSIVGTGVNGFSGDGGPATAAKINYPENVTLDRCGNIYIADFNNARVRKVTYNHSCNPADALNLKPLTPEWKLVIYPNPTHDEVTISAGSEITNVAITNLIGQTVFCNYYHSEQVQVDVAGLPAGIYFVKINGTEVRRFVKE